MKWVASGIELYFCILVHEQNKHKQNLQSSEDLISLLFLVPLVPLESVHKK